MISISGPTLSFRIFQTASAAFTTRYIPNNFEDMSEDERRKWLEEHAWEPLEHMDGDQLYEIINDLAFMIESLFERFFTESVKGGLIEANSDGNLASYLTELDFSTLLKQAAGY